MIKKLLVAGAIFALGVMPARAETVEWDVSLWGKRRAFTEHVERLASLVERFSRGDFKINIHYGDLSPSKENLDGIAAGKFEMAQFCAGYHPEKNLTLTALELPFLGVATLEEELAASLALYGHPATQAEMAKWNAVLLMPTPLPQYNLVGTGAAPTSLDWLSGKAMRATGGIGRAMAAAGAEPVSLTAGETYPALESGEIEAAAFAQHAHFSFNTIALAEWWTRNLDPGTVHCPVVVNADALAALSDRNRRALMRAIPIALDDYILNYNDMISKWGDVLAAFEVTAVEFPEEELAAFRASTAAPIHAEWVAEMDAAGLPGADLLKVVEGALADIRAAPPEDIRALVREAVPQR